MLQGYSSVFQALLGTFFTWAMTAAGAALVFVFSSGQRRILDGSLGFAAGVMLAASYWSLLAPAVEMATSSGGFGAFAFFPVAVGFTLGAAFVYLADLLMPHLGAAEDPQTALALNLDPALMKKKSDPEGPATLLFPERELSIRIGSAGLLSGKPSAAAAELGRREGPDLGLVLGEEGMLDALPFPAAHLTAHSGALFEGAHVSRALSVWNQNTLKTRKSTSFLLSCREESLQRSQIIFLKLRGVQSELGFCPMQLSSSVFPFRFCPESLIQEEPWCLLSA
ncbi:zinc transporter ZIP11 [Arvicola amphibius]|uniref:zinc transporter ZIP11 n=1 Tax=Arvicola amphibius TaxID=1047088 RepID=UPI001C07F020|nr:zinc transporter ZIP11 [Arvicola amphibius]